MSTIAVGKACAGFIRMTRICGNCVHERRNRNEAADRIDRSCGKHGWFVLMSATCKDHQFKEKGANHAFTPR